MDDALELQRAQGEATVSEQLSGVGSGKDPLGDLHLQPIALDVFLGDEETILVTDQFINVRDVARPAG